MPLLPDKASAEEARQAAGLPTEGWKSFIRITQKIARALREADPSISWLEVPYNEKCDIMKDVNEQLKGQKLSPVGMDIITWRMSKAIGNLKQSEARLGSKLHHARAISPEGGTAVENTQPINEAPDVTISGSEPRNKQIFDPVRDL